MLTIILLTYQRTDYAIRTIEGVKRHLLYNGSVQWVVMDDGSSAEHCEAIANRLGVVVQSARQGYGANANVGWAFAESPVTLWLEDDWELRQDMDITPYVKLLEEQEQVGMIRLGHLPVGLDSFSVGFNGRMYLNIAKTYQYAFSGNPHLKHKRFSVYGRYPEGLNPGETEIAYDAQVRSQHGPSILWPLAIGDRFLFNHIGERQSY